MKHAPLTRSLFKNVYIGLSLFWVAATLGMIQLVDEVGVPRILASRTREAESLVRSQREALLFKDHRALRNELQKQGMIPDDRHFEQLWPEESEDAERVNQLQTKCVLLTPYACRGDAFLLISGDPADGVRRATGYAVLLETDYFSSVRGAVIFKILLALLGGGFTLLAMWAIRQQEKFLVRKIGLLASSVSKIEALFAKEGVTPSATPALQSDEFALVSQNLDQAARLLEMKTREIALYKIEYEKKTRLEQLAETLSYNSHNIKAPLEEGASFLHDLPEFLDTMPRETLIRAIVSLEDRLRTGAEDLSAALRSTRESYTAPERIDLSRFLIGFKGRVENNRALSGINVKITGTDENNEVPVFCSPTELNAALWNLLKNSVDAKRDASIQIGLSSSRDAVVITFEDDGPGVPDALLDTIFDDYFTTKAQGSGLGLASVKKSLKRAQGDIKAISAKRGACFKISLPVAGTSIPGGAHA